jgi:PAS domain S-box-containing protein
MKLERRVAGPVPKIGLAALIDRPDKSALIDHFLQAQSLALVASWEFDLRTRVLACSPQMLQIFGWTAEDPPDLEKIRDAVHADDRQAVDAWLAQHRDGAAPAAECRFRIWRADGEIRNLNGRSSLQAAAAGKAAKLIGTVQDVTADLHAAEVISEQAFYYRSMFENAIWGIFQTTADGQYLNANMALARIYGYDSPTAMLTALTDIGRQLYVDASRRDEFIKKMRRNGKVSGFESQVYRRDGAIIWQTV